MATRKTPEGYVLASVMEYLAVKKIFALRMNSGAIQDKRGIPVRMHKPGTADVLALPYDCDPWKSWRPHWIECKAPNGKQSELQKQFQEEVEAEGHVYVLAYGIEDLEEAGL
jgi:hypothetical protein